MINEAASSFGKYVLIERLAAGRTGDVYLARVRGPLGFKKLCVVKRVPRDGEAATSGTFVDEASIAARLTHPHIVQVHEMGEIDRWLYLTTEYVAGKSLRDVLTHAKRGLAAEQAAELFVQLCSALGAAHATGVVHRDVEPTNILVSYSGSVKLIDFGSAASDGSDRTQMDAVGRRVPYMSPEQNAAEDVDERTDVFSAGVCLYETLTGKNPFLRRNPVEALDAVRAYQPPPPSRTSKALRPFDSIIAKALAKDPDDRFPDGNAMADALRIVWRSMDAPSPLADDMLQWFDDDIADEQHLVSVALADADTGFGRRPTNVDKHARGQRNMWIGIAAGAFVVTVLATTLITRAFVRSSDAEMEAKLLATASAESLQPKLNELVVMPAPGSAAKTPVAVEPPTLEPAADVEAHTPKAAPKPAPPPAKPAEPKVVEIKPATATKPAEPKVVETKPATATKPAEPKVVETKPATATKPAEPKVVETKPAPATKPAEPKVAEKKPAPATKPAEPAKHGKHDWRNDPTPTAADDDDDE